MGVKLILDKLFVFSEKNKKYFYTEFDEKVNIIYGKNTAGKSTVFQTIFYALGINDNNELLKEILDENVVIRVDCRLCNENNIEKVIFVRSGDTVIVNRDNKIKCFYGINSNNSREHVKLKKYINSLFNFTLRLENKDGYKEAPIETIFLPYYICQSVGWVYLMKSFSGLEFYKNFRNDYLDFYLGVEDYTDRVRKRELETNLNDVKKKIEFYENFYTNDEKLQVSKLVDEKFKYAADEYLKNYINMQSILQKKQEEYVTNCNTLSYYRNRQALLKKINKNHEEQNPINGNCPMCKQPIKFSIEAAYKYFQEKNDTETELNEIKKNIKSIQSQINKLETEIKKYNDEISKAYTILNSYNNEDISFDTWLKNKSNIKLVDEIEGNIGKLEIERNNIKEELIEFKTEQQIKEIRREKERVFFGIFTNYLRELNVKMLEGNRYTALYKISAFPSQGVELHKTVLAYNVAFNNLISKTNNIHRCPFMLDGIFKEDIEEDNKSLILKFLGNNRPNDTQLIISIAELQKNKEKIQKYNKDYFNGDANIICIGDGCRERAFLQDYDSSINSILNETELIITEV